MLIECDRHTQEDLELWRGYEECDLLHTVPRWKIQEALQAIRSFLEAPAYVGMSGGKDSVAVAHLARRVDRNVRLVHFTWPTDNPYNGLVFASLGWEIEKLPWPDKSIGRYISGIRNAESQVRRLRFYRWGHATENTCAPLAHWSGQDVFAYLAQQGLPAHANYGMLGGGRYRRDRLRVDSLGGSGGDGGGRIEWELEYYPDLSARHAVSRWCSMT